MQKKFEFSKHALLQMADRSLSPEVVLSVLNNPSTNYIEFGGQKVYQQIITFNNKKYLIRIFVNEEKKTALIKTVYKTSKIKKYLV